jgi:hypothetical protein
MAIACAAVVAGAACRRGDGDPPAAPSGSGSAAKPAPLLVDDPWAPHAPRDAAVAPPETATAAAPGIAAVAPARTAAAAPDLSVILRPPGPARPGELVIQAAPLKPGQASIWTAEADLDFDLNFGGFKMDTTAHQSKRKRVEILAIDADGTTHKRVTYHKRETRAFVDGELRKDDTPLPGKTFLVDHKPDAIEVRRPDGKPVTPDELKAVRREENKLQSPEILGRALAGLRLAKDQPFELPAAILAPLLDDQFHARRIVLTYRGKRGNDAWISAEAALDGELDGEGFKLFLDLKGEFVLHPTGVCITADMTGTIRAEFKGTVVGSGAGKAHMTAAPYR